MAEKKKLSITMTPGKKVIVDGVYCRAWNGITASGVRCVAYVHRIEVPVESNVAEFDGTLDPETPPAVIYDDQSGAHES